MKSRDSEIRQMRLHEIILPRYITDRSTHTAARAAACAAARAATAVAAAVTAAVLVLVLSACDSNTVRLYDSAMLCASS